MRVRFTTSVAGANFAFAFDEIADVPDHEALRYIAAGQAVEVETAAVETAAVRQAERAVRPRARFRKTVGG